MGTERDPSDGEAAVERPRAAGVSREARVLFWLGTLVAAGFLIHVLEDVLLPFIAGMAVAYFLDPLADRLERAGLSRTWATTVITLSFFLTVAAVVVLLFPLLQSQVLALAKLVPDALAKLRAMAEPLLLDFKADLADQDLVQLQKAAGAHVGKVLKWFAGVLGGIWSGGVAFFNLLSLLVITPVVSFYLLLEWDAIVAKVDSFLPKAAAPTIREQARAMDLTLAGFVRGQALVCLSLGTFYGVSLTAAGLNAGLLVGLGAGLISFIPFVGTVVGFALAGGIAFFQFGLADLVSIGLVAVIFIIGQVLEGYVLTPRLVGNRIGLHPLWIMFALMAGGALFGFTGVLLAVPVAAVLGVLIRFALGRYLESSLYSGDG